MNKHILKTIRDDIPEPLKYLLAPLFRRKLLNNKVFKTYCDFLLNSENLSSDKVEAYQLNQLRNILIYCYRYVPYYTDLFNSISFNPYNISSGQDINNIPFLTKEIVRQNFERLISTKKVAGGHYLATTGGTTGEPLKVLLDYNSIFKENAFIFFFRRKLGYTQADKIATFRGLEFGNNLWKLNPMYNELIFSPFRLSRLTIRKYIERIKQFNPQYLNGYLSSLYLFTKLLQENNINVNLRLKGIFLISENIDIDQRKFIEDFFNIKSLTFYGHSERCIIAEEHSPTFYKVSPFYGYTELIEQANGFEIIGTGFLNYTMPLVRYKTGDICYRNNDLISIRGRWNTEDYLFGRNDEQISHSAFNLHTDIFKHVINYQFIQQTKGAAELLLVVNKDFKLQDLEAMKTTLEKKTKDVIQFNIKVVDTLILSPRGKFKRFITNK